MSVIQVQRKGKRSSPFQNLPISSISWYGLVYTNLKMYSLPYHLKFEKCVIHCYLDLEHKIWTMKWTVFEIESISTAGDNCESQV